MHEDNNPYLYNLCKLLKQNFQIHLDMGQIEWTEKKLSSYPVVDLNMEWVEMEEEQQIVWENSVEKRCISYIVIGGGKWDSIWTKILILSSTDPLVGTELMRVEISKDSDTGKVSKAVFVDVFKFDDGKGKTTNYVYESETDGKREESGHLNQISEGGVWDYMETLKVESIRAIADLPDRIDVEETIRLFMEQIEDRRLDMPTLVSA